MTLVKFLRLPKGPSLSWPGGEPLQELHFQAGLPWTSEDPLPNTHTGARTPFNLKLTFTLYSWLKNHNKLAFSASWLPLCTEEISFYLFPSRAPCRPGGCKINTKPFWETSSKYSQGLSANFFSRPAFAFLSFSFSWPTTAVHLTDIKKKKKKSMSFKKYSILLCYGKTDWIKTSKSAGCAPETLMAIITLLWTFRTISVKQTVQILQITSSGCLIFNLNLQTRSLRLVNWLAGRMLQGTGELNEYSLTLQSKKPTRSFH